MAQSCQLAQQLLCDRAVGCAQLGDQLEAGGGDDPIDETERQHLVRREEGRKVGMRPPFDDGLPVDLWELTSGTGNEPHRLATLATAAAATLPTSTRAAAGPSAAASSKTSEDSSTAPTTWAGSTASTTMSARSRRRTTEWPCPSTSSTRTDTSPRRGNALTTRSGHPEINTRAESGSSWESVRAVGSAFSSETNSRASARASPEVTIRADIHHNGPTSGWRVSNRRHAVTRPAGSRPKTPRADAASCTRSEASAPDALAT